MVVHRGGLTGKTVFWLVISVILHHAVALTVLCPSVCEWSLGVNGKGKGFR